MQKSARVEARAKKLNLLNVLNPLNVLNVLNLLNRGKAS